MTLAPMKATCKCSLCETTFTRKWNANRHLQNIHLGQGLVVALNGQPLQSATLAGKKQNMIDMKRIWSTYWEERIRALSRKTLEQDLKALGDESMLIKLEFFLNDAFENYAKPPSYRSISHLARKLVYDIDDAMPEPKKFFPEASKKRSLESINLLDFLKQCQFEDAIRELTKKSD